MAMRNKIYEIFLKVDWCWRIFALYPAGIHVCFKAPGCILQRAEFNVNYSV
jgi:hypothetical protein